MRRLFFGSPPRLGTNAAISSEPTIQWIVDSLRRIEEASREDLVTILEGYTWTGTLTETREIDLASPSAANVAAVLATFIKDVTERGQKRQREED